MEKVFITLLQILISLSIYAQVNFEALKISSPYPQASQKLGFTFNQTLSLLRDEKNIHIEVYEFNGDNKVIKEPKLLRKSNLYNGSFIIDSNTHVIVFYIFSDTKVDDNLGDGYFIPIYENKEIIKPYYKTRAALYSFYGERLFGLVRSNEKSLDILEEGFKKYPELQNDGYFYSDYITAINKTGQAKKASVKIHEIEQKRDIPESFYTLLEDYYTLINNKAKSDSFLAIEKQKFPNGNWVSRNLYSDFLKEKKAESKASMYNVFVNKQLPSSGNLQFQAFLKKAISEAYEKEGNKEMAATWYSSLPVWMKMADLNTKSWAMAQEGQDLEMAKKMSAEATMYAKMQFENPTEKKQKDLSTRTWLRELENTYAMYADTYAYILYNLEYYKEGLPFAKAAATIAKFQNAEFNERYAMFLQKTRPTVNEKNILEKMVVLGSATTKTKYVLKELYPKNKKGDEGFDTYITALEGKVKNEKKLELAKSMIKKPSPKFSLKDFEGREVSLESLKGKIIIVDFWATWCGPCIASMPGIKKAQEKLATRNDVIFLFIDTKEHVDNKLENAKEFIKEKKYSFYVLMDNDNKMSNDFDVNGIPTKFIIDKNGDIRFKTIGYAGNTDALADEILQMVEMAGKETKMAR